MKRLVFWLVLLMVLPCMAVDIWVDVDLAGSVDIPVNLLQLTTDGSTIDAGVTFDEAGMALYWNFITTAGVQTQTAADPCTSAGDYDWTIVGNGMYTIEIPASGGADFNNDTEGFGWFTGDTTATLPWRGPVIGFRAATLNNSFIDSAGTLSSIAAVFSDPLTAQALGGLLPEAEVAVVNSQTEFTLATGSTVNDAYNDQIIVGYDDTDSDNPSVRYVTAYVGGTKTVTINSAFDFTLGTDDSVRVFVALNQVSEVLEDTSAQDSAGEWDTLNATVVAAVDDIGTGVAMDGGTATIAGMLTKMADDNGGATFNAGNDSLNKIRARGDTAWITGGGGSAADIADAVWDEILSGHTTVGSAGRALFQAATKRGF